MIRNLLLMLATVNFVFMISCTNDKAPEPVAVNTDTCIAAGDTITYVHDIKPILDLHCTDPSLGSCHQSDADNGSGFDFTSYLGIAAEAANGKLEQRVLDVPSIGAVMPSVLATPPQVLGPCDTVIIRAWINGEWPEN